MNTCKDCKWWGKAQNPRSPYSYGQNQICEHIIPQRNEAISYKASVTPIHDNNYLSDLFTGPDFGCIHWETKP